VHLRHVTERFDDGEPDQVGEGHLPAAAAGQVVVQHDPVVHQQLGRDGAHAGGGRDLQGGLHVGDHAGGGTPQPGGLALTAGVPRAAAGHCLGVGGGGGDRSGHRSLRRHVGANIRRRRGGVLLLCGGGSGGL